MNLEEPTTASLPAADLILGKYLQAIGGGKAASGISTRIQEGTLTVGSEHFPVEILAKAPAKRVTTVRFPGGDSVTAIDRQPGWLSTAGRPPHGISPSEAGAATLDAELFFPDTLGQSFKEVH